MSRSPSPDELNAIKLGKAMEELTETVWWKQLEEIHKEQIQLRTDLLLQPATEETQGARTEHLKGTICGLQLALSTPYAIISTMKAITAEINGVSERN